MRKKILFLFFVTMLTGKKAHKPGQDPCGVGCPNCGGACGKSWTHTLDETVHWCSNCRNTW